MTKTCTLGKGLVCKLRGECTLGTTFLSKSDG